VDVVGLAHPRSARRVQAASLPREARVLVVRERLQRSPERRRALEPPRGDADRAADIAHVAVPTIAFFVIAAIPGIRGLMRLELAKVLRSRAMG